MKLLYFEILKLIKRKSFWGILISFLCVDFLLVYLNFKIEDPYGFRHYHDTQIKEELMHIEEEDVLSYLEYECELSEKMMSYETILEVEGIMEMPTISDEEIKRFEATSQISNYWGLRKNSITNYLVYYKQINNYPSYIQGIYQKSKDIQNSPMWMMMSSKEKDKVLLEASAYEELENVKVKAIDYKGIEAYANSMFSKLIALVWVCILAILIVKEDEEHMHELLLSSAKGHKKTNIAKIGTLILITFVSVLLLQLIDYMAHLYVYGNVDLSAWIQSIPSLYESSMLLTIKEWLCISMIVFAFALSVFAISFMCLYNLFLSKLVAFIFYLFVFLIEALFYTLISEDSFFIFLSHVNIMRLFDGTFIGKVVSYQKVWFMYIQNNLSIVLMCVVIGVVSAFIYVNKYKLKIGSKIKPLPEFILKNTSLYIQEANRILQTNKAILILILSTCVMVGVYTYLYHTPTNTMIRSNEIHTMEIYKKYEGEVNEETSFYLNLKMETYASEEAKYQNMKEAYRKGEITYDELSDARIHYDQRMTDKNVYAQLYELLEKDVSYITYTKGYSNLFAIGLLHQEAYRSIFIILVLILIGSAIVYRKEEEVLYQTCYNGKEKRRNTTFIEISLLSFIAFLIVEVTTIIYQIQMYSLGENSLSLKLLFQLNNVEIPKHLAALNIAQYTLSLIGVKLFAFVSIVIISYMLFRICKNRIIGLFIALLLFLMPMFLYYNGFTFFANMSVFDLCMGNLFLQQSFSAMKLIGICIVDAISMMIIYKSYESERLYEK